MEQYTSKGNFSTAALLIGFNRIHFLKERFYGAVDALMVGGDDRAFEIFRQIAYLTRKRPVKGLKSI